MTLANATRRLNCPPGRITHALSAFPPRLILLTDPVRQPDPLAAAAILPAGSAVLLRHYGDPGRNILAGRLAGLCRRRRLLLLIAADWRLAARLRADGLHLPEGIARHAVLAPALGWVRRHRGILTVAAHGDAGLARATRLHATAALVSPVFSTRSHPGAATLGPLRPGLWRRWTRLPLIALGGIRTTTARRLPPGSTAGLAAIDGMAGIYARQISTPRRAGHAINMATS